MKNRNLLSAACLLVCLASSLPVRALEEKDIPRHVFLNNEAAVALKEGNFALAESKLKASLALKPDFPYAIENYAALLNNLALAKQNKDSWHLLHLAYYLTGDDRTLENLGKHAKASNTSWETPADHIALAQVSLQRRDTITAIVEFELALAGKDDPAIRRQLASIQPPAGTPRRLKDVGGRAPSPVSRFSNSSVGRVEPARFQQDAQVGVDRLLATFKRVEKAKGRQSFDTLEALDRLGVGYTRARKYTEAAASFTDALARLDSSPKKDPAFRALVLKHRGEAFYEEGKLEAAEKDLKAAIDGLDCFKVQLRSDRLDAMELYAKMLYKQSRTEAADKYYALIRQEKSAK
jgi:tetratricopeptide (TPR) repeat protein